MESSPISSYNESPLLKKSHPRFASRKGERDPPVKPVELTLFVESGAAPTTSPRLTVIIWLLHVSFELTPDG